jgi:hypothetical protein
VWTVIYDASFYESSIRPAASVLPAASEPQYVETVIRPPQGLDRGRLGELVKHRELLFFLIWRDVKVKYSRPSSDRPGRSSCRW